jgi:hypothetical protein
VLAGLLGVVIASFLPWLRSGSARKNSYAASGALRSVLKGRQELRYVFDAWPYLALACALAAATVVLGLRLIGAVLALILAAASATVAIGTLAADTSPSIAAENIGPTLTICADALAAIGAIVLLSSRKTNPRRFGRKL